NKSIPDRAAKAALATLASIPLATRGIIVGVELNRPTFGHVFAGRPAWVITISIKADAGIALFIVLAESAFPSAHHRPQKFLSAAAELASDSPRKRVPFVGQVEVAVPA